MWTQSFFVEAIGNATEEAIRKYVKNQLIELDSKEINLDQLDLFLKHGRLRARLL